MLIEVIALYVGLSAVLIEGTGLQKLIMRTSKMVGAWTSKTVLKLRFNFSLVYLGTAGVATKMTAIGSFAPRGFADCFENSDLESKEESRRVTEERF